MCDLVIQASAEEPDIGLLVVNILTKDLSDPNPSVRSSAVSTICSLVVLVPHVEAAVTQALQEGRNILHVEMIMGLKRGQLKKYLNF